MLKPGLTRAKQQGRGMDCASCTCSMFADAHHGRSCLQQKGKLCGSKSAVACSGCKFALAQSEQVRLLRRNSCLSWSIMHPEKRETYEPIQFMGDPNSVILRVRLRKCRLSAMRY
eukprot:525531-Pelagomonas_calceolata.AAC.2